MCGQNLRMKWKFREEESKPIAEICWRKEPQNRQIHTFITFAVNGRTAPRKGRLVTLTKLLIQSSRGSHFEFPGADWKGWPQRTPATWWRPARTTCRPPWPPRSPRWSALAGTPPRPGRRRRWGSTWYSSSPAPPTSCWSWWRRGSCWRRRRRGRWGRGKEQWKPGRLEEPGSVERLRWAWAPVRRMRMRVTVIAQRWISWHCIHNSIYDLGWAEVQEQKGCEKGFNTAIGQHCCSGDCLHRYLVVTSVLFLFHLYLYFHIYFYFHL